MGQHPSRTIGPQSYRYTQQVILTALDLLLPESQVIPDRML